VFIFKRRATYTHVCVLSYSASTLSTVIIEIKGRPQSHNFHDCETVGIPPLMSRKTLGILDGGRGGASIAREGVGVLKVWIRAEHNILDC